MYVITDNKEQFEQNLRDLCLHKSYNNEKYPGSVENIILTDRCTCLVKQMDILSYFLYYHQNFRNLEDIKLQEYVVFIRSERTRLFPNNYSIKPRKFISNQFFKRSSTLADYINNYVLNNVINKREKDLISKPTFIRKLYRDPIECRGTVNIVCYPIKGQK